MADIQQVGEEIGPFRIFVTWKENASEPEMIEAQTSVSGLINEINAFPEEIPPCVKSMLIQRI